MVLTTFSKMKKGYERVPGVKFSPKQMSFYFLRKIPNGKRGPRKDIDELSRKNFLRIYNELTKLKKNKHF